jgi:nucleoside-diphosphate-sugar epimerase
MSEQLLAHDGLPATIADEETLEEFISRPTQALIDDLAALDGDIMVLGVAGKVGPGLARMAKRAAPGKRVVGVARFSDPDVKRRLESWGVETIACDLLDRAAVNALPKIANVIYMAGRKFGTTGDEAFSWAMNAHVPGIVAEALPESRIVAFSTLCVYPFASVSRQDCDESTPPTPVGEYANSCVGRERIFQYFSKKFGTPGRLIRLNYAIDLRYGVLYDVANWVRNGEPIDLTSGHASVIWHGDVNNQILRALRHCEVPSAPLNVGGPEATSIRALAHMFGARFGREPVFVNEEADTGWVNRTDLAQRLFGYPVVPLDRMVDWVADWIERGMPGYDKPTRYEVRDGNF